MYGYVNLKYENAKLCYIDIDSFIVHVQKHVIYKGIPEDVETRFDTSNFELDRPFLEGKNGSNWINERWIRQTNHDWKNLFD